VPQSTSQLHYRAEIQPLFPLDLEEARHVTNRVARLTGNHEPGEDNWRPLLVDLDHQCRALRLRGSMQKRAELREEVSLQLQSFSCPLVNASEIEIRTRERLSRNPERRIESRFHPGRRFPVNLQPVSPQGRH
jgi:hypothetical protein